MRARAHAGLLVLEGDRLIDTALASGYQPKYVLHHPDYSGATLAKLRETTTHCLPISPTLLAQLSDVETPPGILAVFPEPKLPLPNNIQRALILDAVREPGNLGAILRTAVGAGVEIVLLAPECADPFNPKAVRAAAGAHFRIPLHRLSWEEIAAVSSGQCVYLADSSAGVDYSAINWAHLPWALIVSNEAHGPSAAARRLATERLRIPLAEETESLNVAAATAVLLFEARRQSAR